MAALAAEPAAKPPRRAANACPGRCARARRRRCSSTRRHRRRAQEPGRQQEDRRRLGAGLRARQGGVFRRLRLRRSREQQADGARHHRADLLDDQAGHRRGAHEALRARQIPARRSARGVRARIRESQGVTRASTKRAAEIRSAEAQADHARHPAPHRRFHGDGSTTTRGRRLSTARSIRAAYGNTLPEVRAEARARCRWPINPARAGCIRDAVDVQAYLVQKISGVPFDKFLELHIFKPLGMTTHALHHPADRSRIARSSRPCTRATTTARFTRQSGRGGLRVQRQRLAAQARQLRAGVHHSTTT